MSQPIPGVIMLLSHRACFFLVCVYSVTIPNSSPNPQQPFPSLTINIHNGQQQNQSATATSDVESSLKNSSTSSAKANNKPDNSWIHYLHDFYNRACSKKDDGISFLKNHPFKIMGGTFMCCYFYLVCKIKQCKKMIYSPESWCCWNSSIETTELTMFPYSKVHNQLIEDIHNEFYNSSYRPGLVLSSTFSLRHWLGATLNYGIYSRSSANVGFGLRIRGFYVLTDNLVALLNYQAVKAASVCFGFNLVIGKPKIAGAASVEPAAQ